MARQLIVAIFDSVNAAQRAGHDFRAVEEKDEGFKVERGALVQKDPTGNLVVIDEQTRPFRGTVPDLLDIEWVTSISGTLTPGSAAFILDAQEASPFAIDNVVLGYGGSVFRKPLA